MKLDTTNKTSRWGVERATDATIYSKSFGVADKTTRWHTYWTALSTTHGTTGRATRDAIKKFMKAQS